MKLNPEMESTLRKLLSNDNNDITEGSRELKEYLKNPNCISVLCNVLSTCKDHEVRHYASVVLKRRFSKHHAWESIPVEDRKSIKNGLILILIAEPEKPVKNGIVSLMKTILKYEIPTNSWPELSQFLEESLVSENMNNKELGLYTLSLLVEGLSLEHLAYFLPFIANLPSFLTKMEDLSCPAAYFLVQCTLHFVMLVTSKRELVNTYASVVPIVLQVIKAQSAKRPDRALDTMDFLFEFSEREGLPVLMPCIKQIIGYCIEIVHDNSYLEDLKMKALSFITTMARIRIKTLQKNGLIEPILSVIFQVMCSKPDDDEDEGYFTSDPDEDTLMTCACEGLDTVALSMDAKKLINPVMEFVKNAVQSPNPYEKKAGYLALGIVAQGCENYIRHNCLQQLVTCVHTGVANESHPAVRAAALFSLGQFAEHLQPEISVHAEELLPVLIRQLEDLILTAKNGVKVGSRVDRLFYSIERFAEYLEDRLTPFLKPLVEAILQLWDSCYHTHVRELALSSMAVCVGAVKDDIMPYFQEIIVRLNHLLRVQETEIDPSLRVEAIDALAVMARSVSADNFKPLALESVQLGLSLTSSSTDPDVKKSCYGLFSSVSCVLKGEMAPMLPTIIPLLIKTIQEDIGQEAPTRKDEDSGIPFNELDDALGRGENDNDDDDDSDEDYEAISVENDFVEEKEEACFALSEFASNLGIAFYPYLQHSYEEVFKLLKFPNSDVRKAAVEAEFQFCVAFSKMTENKDPMNLIEVTQELVLKASELALTDDDRDVVLAILEGFRLLLDEVGFRLTTNNMVREKIYDVVKSVLNKKTEIQSWDDEDDEDGPDAELLDTASYVIPSFAKAMTTEEFSVLFSNALQLLNERLAAENANLEGDDDEEDYDSKANVIGVLAECMPGLGLEVANYKDKLLPYLLTESRNPDPDIRNNALFTIGEMAFHGKHTMFEHHFAILGVLSDLMSVEKESKVMDNACGVIARLILTNPQGLPLDQLVPALISKLPLKEDFDEDKYVYRALGHLFELGADCIKLHIGDIFKAAAFSLHSHTPDDETKEVFNSLLKVLVSTFPEECRSALSQLPQDVASALNISN